jgi:hypothetical protein
MDAFRPTSGGSRVHVQAMPLWERTKHHTRNLNMSENTLKRHGSARTLHHDYRVDEQDDIARIDSNLNVTNHRLIHVSKLPRRDRYLSLIY